MSWTEHARSLVAYNEWANKKVLSASAALNENDFGREVAGSHKSVGATLLHMVRVQIWWLSVLNGKPGAAPMPDVSGLPFGKVTEWFVQSHGDLREYAAGLTEERLSAEVSAFNPREGKEYRWPSWQLFGHLMNHSAHHRAEAGLMLASLGHSPGDMDFIFFPREG